VPIAPNGGGGTSLEAGLQAAETQTLTKPPRVALPDDDVEDDEPGAPESPASKDASPQEPPAKPLTHAQANKKMDALVGQLRDGGYITTQQLYAAMAKARNIDVATMSEVIEGAWGTDGALHWGPLRDSLTLAEARELHARLARLWVNVVNEA
jgi:hypothetical protein